SNDSGSTYQSARGSNDYSWGKKTSRNNHAAQIEPTGHSETTRRSGMTDDYLTPAQRRAYESQARFAKGGKITPAWTDRPYHVKQRMAHSNSPRIHAEHSGEGLVLNIHLSDVGPHAITLGHSGGVDASRMVQGFPCLAVLRSPDTVPCPGRALPAATQFGSRLVVT